MRPRRQKQSVGKSGVNAMRFKAVIGIFDENGFPGLPIFYFNDPAISDLSSIALPYYSLHHTFKGVLPWEN
jgi:hypothetical protein